jgi:preprotein translocase subunit SecA
MMVGLLALMKTFRVEDLPIKSKMLTKSLDEAQKKVERYFYVSDNGSILHRSAID